MQVIPQPLPDVYLLKSACHSDARGCFIEQFNAQKFADFLGYAPNFVQDNFSLSQRAVLRGLHYQRPPYEQGKLIRLLTGAIVDVCVDLRRNSSSYGQHLLLELQADPQQSLWIPPGFAHGFLALTDATQLQYKVTAPYQASAELSLDWGDAALAIDWQLPQRIGQPQPLLSAKDAAALSWAQFQAALAE